MNNSIHQDFGQIGNEFINLYSKENPILNAGDIAYFLFNNNVDYHRPLIGRGTIIEDRFSDGLNKIYFMQIIEIIESPNIITEFFLGQTFVIYPWFPDAKYTKRTNDGMHNKKYVSISKHFDFKTNLFRIEAFFIRDTEEKIQELRVEYIKIIKKDIVKQLSDIEVILN